ncbi:MAG TPA: DUF58 domain-containing protein [Acidobacteriota bacterium]|nr:DUF58 domain-containing protein [Acidobacteriota bacterium]
MTTTSLRGILPPFLKIRLPRMPIAVEFTREGLIFIFLSLAIGAAAVNTGNNILYLIFSLMLGLIVVSGILSRRILNGLSCAIEFPAHLFAGVPANSFVSIQNHKRKLPSIGVRFTIKEKGFPLAEKYFFFVPAGEKVSSFLDLVFPRRGIYRLSELELRTKFPFSFFIKIRRSSVNQTVRVYPKIYRITDDAFARYTEGLLKESPYRGESPQLLHLRDYKPLDSSKRIHWKASAKIEKFLVKEFQRDQGRDFTIYFDCFPGGSGTSQSQEKAISVLASIAFKASEKGYHAKFCFPGSTFEIGNGQTISPLLDHLSEMKISAPSGKFSAPSGPHTIVLVVRSRSITPVMTLTLPHATLAWVEDFSMQESVKEL